MSVHVDTNGNNTTVTYGYRSTSTMSDPVNPDETIEPEPTPTPAPAGDTPVHETVERIDDDQANADTEDPDAA